MELLRGNTHWYIILPASGEPETRHIYDVAFGIKCLISKSVSYDSISVVIDNAPHPSMMAVFGAFGLSLPGKIYKTDDLKSIIDTDSSENAVVFITGHGSPEGLDSQSPIKPFPLYRLFQTAPNYKRVVIYLGQCYAGIFNNLPVSDSLGEKDSRCSVVAVGGTGLSPSLSLSTSIKNPFQRNHNITWVANVFLFYIFCWIMSPSDVDGDNSFSVMDSFKFATIHTNKSIEQMKRSENLSDYVSFLEIIKQLKDSPANDSDGNNQLVRLSLERMINLRYTIQEPWILNSEIAMETSFVL